MKRYIHGKYCLLISVSGTVEFLVETREPGHYRPLTVNWSDDVHAEQRIKIINSTKFQKWLRRAIGKRIENIEHNKHKMEELLRSTSVEARTLANLSLYIRKNDAR